MERYKKEHGSKRQNRYTEEFKQSICEEFIGGEGGLSSLERKHNLGHSVLKLWLLELGCNANNPYILETDPMPTKPSNKPDDPMADRVRQLEKQLEMARLEAAAYRAMIEIAERDLKIEIRKKSDTGQ